MSEESKKIEKKAEQTEQEVKPAELSEQDLDNVAGGGQTMGMKDWGKAPPPPPPGPTGRVYDPLRNLGKKV